MKKLGLLFLLATVFACSSPQTEVPTQSLNDVLACANLAGLQTKYGKENVVADTSWVIGADTLQGSMIFPRTSKQVNVYYRSGEIVDVTIQGKSSAWKTDSGLYLGLPLQDVQQLNAKNFTLSGFNWAHGGEVVSWEGGKLAGIHLATFSNTGNQHDGLSDAEYTQISGQTEFDVRHEAIQKLNPSLDMISLIKPFIPNQEEGKSISKRISANQIPPAK
ncbi:hypothetical protein [Aquirufa sp.]|jgi:hypothetical protein|uniref:hypothetical protein n=1 Tax=Aquirufa sp. TaxID=2676249 RepID=UPI0037C18271